MPEAASRSSARSTWTRPAIRTTVLTVAALLCSGATALASGLTLVGIPGPNGAMPFKSPGGFGPTFVASPPGDTHRVFVGTKDGYIYVIDDGVLAPTPFLDWHTKVSTYNEDGMFSLAFDPNYASNRRFYVDYSDTVDTSAHPNLDNYHLDEFQTSVGNPDVADPLTEKQILEVPTSDCMDMSSPHYGGQLQFGPDGHLWLTIGDGGDGGGDPATRGPNCSRSSPLNAPDLDSLHGKILRIDPQPAANPDADGNRYSIPSDNPLVGQTGVRQEVWAYGLRNPYRFSFDPATHDLVIGDVGNDQQEEIDRVPYAPAPASPPFFGWPCMEGTLPFFSGGCGNWPTPLPTPVAPLITFDHGGGCAAVIGGLVLHDPSLGGDHDGRYLYGYFCASGLSGELLTTDLDAATPAPRDEGVGVGFGLSSFGQDACGHPYATNVILGGLWRIEGLTPGPCGEFTPPQTTLTSAPSGIVTQTTQSVSFSSNIVGSTFTCALDGAAAQTCSSPNTYTGLAEGSHTVSVTASDEAHNADPTPATASFIVDTGPPDTTIASGPAAFDAHSSATFTFTASESDTTFTCALDGAAAQTCSSPNTYTGLAEGAHTLAVTATDAAGNTDATPATASWTVDTTQPDTTITSAPPPLDSHPSATLSFTSSESNSTFTCSLDGGTAQTCTSPSTYTGLTDGLHTLSVIATDHAGNADASPSTATWIVDTGPPNTTITSGPPAADTQPTATFAFTASENDATFSCSLDGAAAQPCSSPKTYTGLAQGSHTLAVTATDQAGNADATPAVDTWTVHIPSPPPPTTTTTPPPLTTTVTHPPGLPPIHISLRNLKTLKMDAHGKLRITLSAVPQSARGTLTLRNGKRALARAVHFRMTTGKPITVSLSISSTTRRSVARHHGLSARLTLSLTGADGKAVAASATVRVLAPR